MNYMYEIIKFYILSFYYSIISFATLSMLYIPIHILVVSLILNGFKSKNLKERITILAKPLFCATLQSFATLAIVVTLVARGLQGALHFFSISLVVDRLEILLIIIFSFLYSRAKMNVAYSWLLGIGLFIFSIPVIGFTLYILSIYATYTFFYTLNTGVRGFITTFLIIFIAAIIQLISLRKIIYIQQKQFTKVQFFNALFISNAITLVLIKGFLILCDKQIKF